MKLRKDAILGYGIGLAAALCFAGVYVLIGMRISDTSPLVGVTFSLLCGTLLLLPFSLRNPSPDPKVRASAIKLCIIAGVVTGIGQALMYISFTMAPVVVVSPLIHTQPLFTLVGVYLFLRQKEKLTVKVILGALLIVAGVALITIGRTQ